MGKLGLFRFSKTFCDVCGLKRGGFKMFKMKFVLSWPTFKEVNI